MNVDTSKAPSTPFDRITNDEGLIVVSTIGDWLSGPQALEAARLADQKKAVPTSSWRPIALLSAEKGNLKES